MCRLAVLLLVSLSLLWACRGDAGQGRRAHGGREQKMTFGGFLEHKGWLSSKEDLVRFGLVTDPGDLAEPPSRWRIKTGGWLDDETYLNRLRASVLEETYAEGKLKIDDPLPRALLPRPPLLHRGGGRRQARTRGDATFRRRLRETYRRLPPTDRAGLRLRVVHN